MRIAVVGPGALGCFFAARLAMQPGHEVLILDHAKERAEFIASKGLKLIEKERTFPVKVGVALYPEEIGRPDLILLCVKSHHVPIAIERIRSLAADDNLLIALQNGIAHHRVLQEEYPGPWALGVTAQGAALEGQGVVRHGGEGDTVLGFAVPEGRVSGLLEKSAQAFAAAGIPTVESREISIHVWKKFVVNIGINALTVIFDCPNGKILDSPPGRERMAKAVREAVMVAEAKGIRLGAEALALPEKVCRATAINISSMLQDVRRKKKTEIDAINGALVREARLYGIPVPENEKLERDVKAIEARYLSQ
jgi:2-dehydropantoate 2-reductase